MQPRGLIAKLYQSSKTVFTNKDLAVIWGETDEKNLNAKTAYYVRRKELLKLTRSVFAKNKDFDFKELAASLYAPSYISFETVLREAGIIFQHYESVYAAGPWTRRLKIAGRAIVFRKLKDTVLFDPSGVSSTGNYSIAEPERALLDTLYLFPKFYFDNLHSINWEKCEELVKIYDNKQLIKRLANLKKTYAE